MREEACGVGGDVLKTGVKSNSLGSLAPRELPSGNNEMGDRPGDQRITTRSRCWKRSPFRMATEVLGIQPGEMASWVRCLLQNHGI